MTNHYSDLIHWLTHSAKHKINTIHAICGDASFRRYYRVNTDKGTYIVMDASTEKETLDDYLNITKLFQQNDIMVPQIFAQDVSQGFLLLSDFGDDTLLRSLSPSNADTLYRQALQILNNIQRIPVTETSLPHFNADFMQRELQLFHQWFLQKQLNLHLTPAEQQMLTNTYQTIVQQVESQPYCCVHRDYHSRNLVSINNECIGVLDFQDAVYGPVSYDIVSLLRDCYIEWPTTQANDWIQFYLQNSRSLPCLTNVTFDGFNHWVIWTGFQRHMKAIGIFARLNKLYQKPNYLRDIPRALHYITMNCKQENKLTDFNDFIQSRIFPEMQHQQLECTL